ncbi:hypothetical protein A2U01_0102378, partial [Trifolium medium]|nr:hypothetical protein [Trifolium medium]
IGCTLLPYDQERTSQGEHIPSIEISRRNLRGIIGRWWMFYNSREFNPSHHRNQQFSPRSQEGILCFANYAG